MTDEEAEKIREEWKENFRKGCVRYGGHLPGSQISCRCWNLERTAWMQVYLCYCPCSCRTTKDKENK